MTLNQPEPLERDAAVDRGAVADAVRPAPDLVATFGQLEERYRGLIDRLPAVVYLDGVGPDAPMIDVSRGVEDLLGISREALLASPQSWVGSVHPDDRERVIAESASAVAAGEPFRIEYRTVLPGGGERWIREESILVRDARDRPIYWLGVMHDVTELNAARQQLRDAESRYGSLVEQIPAIVYTDLVDEHWTTTYVSPQIEPLLGYTPAEYVGASDLWGRMLHPDDRDATLEGYERGRDSGEPFTLEYRLIARDGHVVWFQDRSVMLTDGDGTPLFVQGVMMDISERKEAEAQIAFLAYHDKLTNLPNRAMFDEFLELALRRGQRTGEGVALISLDVDDFKLINDSLGHEAGDALIAALAERLAEATRDTDLVARPGSDEFLVLLSDLDRTPPLPGGQDGATIAAEGVAVRIQQALRHPFNVGGTELYLTASMGISVFPNDDEDGSVLLKNADTAMFRSKKAGPGGFLVHAPENASPFNRLSLSTRLRKAVELKQWMLHYQPLVELDSGHMFGVEALIRWPEPNGGLVPPGEFIPLAEEMGLIEAIGDWVVEEICRQDAQWRSEGLELEIGFNLSPRQLWQPDLADKIVSPIVVAGIDPTRVTVEITESTAMTDPERVVTILRELHDRGLKLAIDDFGTGYSSLARLKHMPVDILKIDRSFIRDVDKDHDAASMVVAMISLAENLGMIPLAEGIETLGEWTFLAEHGCALGQGFHFSRPVPAREIMAMVRRSSIHLVEGEAGA